MPEQLFPHADDANEETARLRTRVTVLEQDNKALRSNAVRDYRQIRDSWQELTRSESTVEKLEAEIRLLKKRLEESGR